MVYLLDSSAIIELFCGKDKGMAIDKFLGKSPLKSSSFSVYEVLKMLRKHEELVSRGFFQEAEIISFGENEALESVEIEKELKKSGTIINRVDIFIAGICRFNNYEIITCDKHFTKIKSLKVHLF